MPSYTLKMSLKKIRPLSLDLIKISYDKNVFNAIYDFILTTEMAVGQASTVMFAVCITVKGVP